MEYQELIGESEVVFCAYNPRMSKLTKHDWEIAVNLDFQQVPGQSRAHSKILTQKSNQTER